MLSDCPQRARSGATPTFDPHPQHPHLVAVLGDHTHPEPADVQTLLFILDTKAQAVYRLLSGVDFYNAPHLSTDG
jgi:hypothetical protein